MSPRRSAPERHPLAVPPQRLRWRCPSDGLDFETTAEIDPCGEILAQERALRAIRLGLEVESRGYHIFVSGPPGTGRTTTVLSLLGDPASRGEPPEDLVYVNNFRDPDRPALLRFPAGRGRAFRDAMEGLVAALARDIPRILDSEGFRGKQKALVEASQKRQKETIKELERAVQALGFALVEVQMGPITRPDLVPMVAGNPVSLDDLEALAEKGQYSEDSLARLKEQHAKLATQLEEVMRAVQRIEREAQEGLVQLAWETVRPTVKHEVGEIRGAFGGSGGVADYLEDVERHIEAEMQSFRGGRPGPDAGPPLDPYLDFRVNLLVDNGDTKGRPVVVETSPTYRNLFGTIERIRDPRGEWRTDFTRIKPGSIHRANGGFLVVNALDVLVEPGVWPALKRMLRNRRAEIQAFEPFFALSASSINPEPIPLSLKVVMIGTPRLYHLVRGVDEDFSKIFRIKADFDDEAPRSPELIRSYACFVRKVCGDDNLPPLHRDAIEALVEEAVRLAGRQDRLTTRFHMLQDLVREAAFWARSDGASVVVGEHVRRAVDEHAYRSNLAEEKWRERITRGDLLIDTEGSRVGQVNGLAAFDVGDYRFGMPVRITASVAMGRGGIIDIEREAALSGATHTKGVLILAGFLRERFAQDKPLAVSASLCFEQSYGAIDGDSASSTEVYALLSALSGLPLRQDLAVTGSVNQRGEVQVIGAVNEKIEGFFRLAEKRGLSGSQGVIIPRPNVDDLMLRPAVVEAVEQGAFHVYAVERIEEGIELLTGRPAGERGEDGRYPPGTVFALVDRRLRAMAEGLRGWIAPGAAETERTRGEPEPS